MGMTDKSLCDSCTNIGCEFQSGIVRTKCAFYMPPQLEPDNCGNYVVQDSTTKNDIRDNRVKNELNRVKDELEPATKNGANELISREDALMCLTGKFENRAYEPSELISLFSKRIKALSSPSVTSQLRKGYWIYDYTSADGHRTYHCSECGCYLQPKHSEPLNSFKWCSLCGADMREDDEE